jgi:hypothetical protein
MWYDKEYYNLCSSLKITGLSDERRRKWRAMWHAWTRDITEFWRIHERKVLLGMLIRRRGH